VSAKWVVEQGAKIRLVPRAEVASSAQLVVADKWRESRSKTMQSRPEVQLRQDDRPQPSWVVFGCRETGYAMLEGG
jgi:hypothetical protein